ncbi:hypothetical protein ACWDRR_26240 [Kitasatospora sp. NPDC003701]
MNTQNSTPAGTAGLPRNAVRLTERARAAGWTVSTERETGSVTVRLTAQVRHNRESMAVEVVCCWEEDQAHALRWRNAILRKDGRPIADPFGWREVGSLLERFAPVMIDAAAEKAGRTHHGLSAGQWSADADEQHQAAAGHASEVRGVQRRLQEERAAGAAWAAVALDVVTAQAERVRDAEEAARVLAEESGEAGARGAFEMAEEARTLAKACEDAARLARNAALDAEAEELCAPYVAAQLETDEAEETAWRADNPNGTAEEFARTVVQAYEVPARQFGQWWAERHRPGMTYLQGYDAFHPGADPRAELGASMALDRDTNRAVYALGAAAAALLRAGGDQAQQGRAGKLEEESRRGEELYAPGARRRIGEGHQAAVRVWSALVDRGWNLWLSLDVLQDFVTLELWERAGAVEEATALRRLLLIDHGLRRRRERHDAVRERMEAERIARHRAGEEVYKAARQAGEDEESADWARWDFLARRDAEEDGQEEDGRGRFARGADVWAQPADDEPGAVPYAGRIVAYRGRGRFRVTGPAGTVPWEVLVDRLSPAEPDEARQDRARQEAEAARRREERAARDAEEQRRREEARAVAEAALARRLARRRAAAGTVAPVGEHGQWNPIHSVPRSVAELWAAAAEGGWRMTCRTGTDGQMLVVRIAGTTDAGLWVFELIWLPERGQYSVRKQLGAARWADGRSGPRGGRIRPTVRDVLLIIMQETREGAEARPGELVGGPGRPEPAAPVARD